MTLALAHNRDTVPLREATTGNTSAVRKLGRSLAMTFIKGINNVTQLAVRRGQAARLGSNLRNLRNYVIFSKLRKLAISLN